MRKSDFNYINVSLHIVLTEDDFDDRILYTEALEELPIYVILTTVTDGEQLPPLLREDTQNFRMRFSVF